MSKNLEEARRLAVKLGYIPQDQRPEVIVAMGTPQGRLDELVASGYRPVTDERWSRMLGELPDEPRIVTDSVTGRREYVGSFQPQAIAGLTVSSSPPTIMERPRNSWLTGAFEIDRFSLNPGRDSVLQQLNEADLVGPAPKMFGNADLPPITGSGADPQLLRLVGWQLRTSAAFASSRAHVLEMILMSQEPALDESLQTDIGRMYLNAYFAAVRTWASMVPDNQDAANIDEQIATIYGPGAD